MKKIKYIVSCALCIVLVACSEKSLSTAELRCGDMDISVTVFKNKIDAVVNGVKFNMPNVVSASGARYEGIMTDGSKIILWNKGEDWMMISEDNAIACISNVNEIDDELSPGTEIATEVVSEIIE